MEDKLFVIANVPFLSCGKNYFQELLKPNESIREIILMRHTVRVKKRYKIERNPTKG